MKARFPMFDDSQAASCRWSNYARELFGDWEVVWDASYADYQGTVEFLAHKDGKFAYLTYSYGSCSGCDSWEDMPDDDVRADFKNMAEYFDDIYALQRFVDQVNYDKGLKEAVSWFTCNIQLEEELAKE